MLWHIPILQKVKAIFYALLVVPCSIDYIGVRGGFWGFKRYFKNNVVFDEGEKGGVSKIELIAVFSFGTIFIKMGFLHLYLDHLNQLFLVSN